MWEGVYVDDDSTDTTY
jgi:hypothetical protein